ncbi:MAG: sigma-54-dependent transcriptional regulator [Planctomycetota bacterium]
MSESRQSNKNQAQRQDDIANVLIVDNDCETARLLLELLARKGIRGHLAADEETALNLLDKGSFDLLFASDEIPRRRENEETTKASSPTQQPSRRPAPAFDLLEKIRASWPEMPLIMMGRAPEGKSANDRRTGRRSTTSNFGKASPHSVRPSIRSAVKAIQAGCCDFLLKPLDHDEIEALLDTLLPNHKVAALAWAQQDTHYLYRIVGKSTKLTRTVDLAERIAPTSVPVLISGPSGTGKELVSYLVHHKSNRAQGPYIKINCAALSDSLLESELFGHEKGAFTGAYNQRRGRFEMAHGGTLLLDEITETPPRFQAKLLRVLEQQDFERVGGDEIVKVNVRIISTTNKDLLQEVRQGRFRRDLYYRLSGVRLVIAPLRERKEDLGDLVWHFVNLYAREARRRISKLDPVMMNIFAKYDWPGNVRQLRNTVRTSLILGSGETLSLADVSWLLEETPACNDFRHRPKSTQLSGMAHMNAEKTRPEGYLSEPDTGLGGVSLAQIERQAILDTLHQTAGNQTKAAKVLGISDRTLRDKIRRYRQEERLQVTSP